jgi:uncharacterized protein
VSAFVDTSAWYAATDAGDRSHQRATALLSDEERLVTSDHVLVETWLLVASRGHRTAADGFWGRLRGGVADIESVTASDLATAWAIGEAFEDQDFSIVDRTSFAVMERLGVHRAISFDNDFAVYRFGKGRRQAFTVLR